MGEELGNGNASKTMTIKYSDGKSFEAVLLLRTENTIRLAVEGADDVMELTDINGTWVSDDCEPVFIEFAWQRHAYKPAVDEADCCCSRELAARLIHSLFAPGDEDSTTTGDSSGFQPDSTQPAAQPSRWGANYPAQANLYLA